MTDAPTDVRALSRTARFAGVLYLALFFLGPFSIMYVPGRILVAGDAAATAANVAASGGLLRAGVAVDGVIVLVEVALTVLLYLLTRPVSRGAALVAASARLGEAVIQGVNLLGGIFALALLGGATYLEAFRPEQLQALAMLALESREFGVLIWQLFFGFHLVVLGWLVWKADYFPAILGALLALAGAGYLVDSFGNLLAPQHADVLANIVLVPAVIGELSFTVYLLARGVRRPAEPARREPVHAV